MQKTNVYVMLDSETTGLDTRSAVAWQVGMLAFIHEGQHYVPISNLEVSSGVSKEVWEPSTLEFAVKTYGQALVDTVATKESFTDYVAMMQHVVDYFNNLIDGYGYKNVHVICNHTEFDWPILLNSFSRAGIALPLPGLVHYANKLDMKSLCIGRVGKQHAAVYKAMPYKPVLHQALADCYSQLDLLDYFGVELP